MPSTRSPAGPNCFLIGIAGALWCLTLAGCERETKPEAKPGPPTPPPSAQASLTVAPPVPAPPLAMAARTCRALSVRGKVTREEDGAVLRSGDALDDAPWLVLEDKATLVVKHAETARELSFSGPGAVRPCFQDAEHFLIQKGSVRTTAGVGARPGAEVLLSTPLAAIRYGDALLDAEVGEERVVVKVQQGAAWIEGNEPEPAPEEVAEGGSATRQGKPPDVKVLVKRCEAAAAHAEQRGLAVLDGKAERRTLGARAAEHIRARQAARKACGIAAAGLGAVEEKSARTEWSRRLEEADAQWRRVPRPAKAR